MVGNFFVLVKGVYWLYRCGLSGFWSFRVLIDGYLFCVELRIEGVWVRRDFGMFFFEGLRLIDFGIVCLFFLIIVKFCGVFIVY